MGESEQEQVSGRSDEAPEVRAKPLPRRLPVIVEAPALVPARMVNEALYCERLMYLEWSQGEFVDNAFTVDGRSVHRRADRPGGALPPPPKRDETDDEDEPEEPAPYEARALWLSSEELGLTAKIDVVEADASSVVPIEYKRGAAPDVPEGAHLPERAQVCVQVLLLREHGYRCDHGEIYFARTRRRVRIEIDDALIATTMEAARRARELAAGGVIPPPLVDSSRCEGCSLVGVCLPDETNLLRGLEPAPPAPPAEAEAMEEFWPADEAPEADDAPVELRRLQPARDDELPLYVQEQGAKIGISGEELVIKGKKGDVRARLPNVSQVSLFGNVQISTQALRAILERGLSISFLSTGGWFYGRATGVESKNVELRMAQHRAMAEPDTCLRLARGVIASKIRNSRTMLRRNNAAVSEVVLWELEQLAKKAERCEALESLLGIEGTAARSYFGAFSGMLKGEGAAAFDLDGRNRRPPRDPVNALLSLSYALLTKELAHVCASAGLDPLLGFYHQPRFGRPALALDLMEEFRPILSDSIVISAINTGVITESDFISHTTGVALRPHGRRRFLGAYERRMDQLVTHPVFGYRVSYRRVLEVQARLLGRFLLGEISAYPQFRTR
ncbi:MAG: CRISPR-associated endonuclease Cas1 [Labilithrix sp.]|nr:CRISPR-associated endonuclease Cas1 [Labilithrix sp.]MCW5815788.1 CRISPR-associated endonuclease Cas1 [Labilithrix sp.]